MKVWIGILVATVLCANVQAQEIEQTRVGAFIYKQVGNPETDVKWQSCTITATEIKIVNSDAGVVSTSVVNLGIDENYLNDLILSASQKSIDTALNSQETIPNVRVAAGVAINVPEFVLIQDDASRVKRQGAESQALVYVADLLCGGMQVPQFGQ